MTQPASNAATSKARRSDAVYKTEGGRTYLENLRKMTLSKDAQEVLRQVEAETAKTDEE